MNAIYKATVSTSGGRNGIVKSENGILDLEVRVPKEMGGPGGDYTNPEQLFAAGYSACFDGALNLVATQNKVRVKDTKVTATVGFCTSETDGFSIAVNLDVEIPGIERSVAEDLLKKADSTCPYSKAIRNNVEVTLNLV